jgi:ribosomal protein S18 acetylase RimI-like enzyme
MPEIEIRPAIAADIPQLIALEHNYTSDYVWQIDIETENDQVRVFFREIRLPRSVRVEYPRKPQILADDWYQRAGLLVAIYEGEPVGYVSLNKKIAPSTTWIDDLVVKRRLRRQGIGTTLVMAAQNWASSHACRRIVLEMQSKNHPAIRLAKKLGFDFCGYDEWYFSNHDIALFFTKVIG